MPAILGGSGLKLFRRPVYSLTGSASSVNEGETFTFTLTTDGPDGTFYWTNSGTTTGADFTDSANSGSFMTAGGVGSFTRTLSSDFTTEGAETIIMRARTSSVTGTIVASSQTVTVGDTSKTPVYSLTESVSSVNEGGSVTFTLTTDGPDGTFYWTNDGTSTSADFTDGLMSGSFITTAGTGSITRSVKGDLSTEGVETIMMNVHTSQVGESIVASSFVTIVDSSQTQYSITNSANSVNEGSSVTFTFTFTTDGNDGTFYWTNVGSATTSDFTDSITSGSFITTAGTGSIVRTLTSDVTTEGAETVMLQIRSGSFSGPVVALSSAVTVNDTSLTPSTPWTPALMINPSVSSRTNTAVWLDSSVTNGLVVSSLSSGGLISSIPDQSGNGHNPYALTNFRRPTLILNGLNGLPVHRYNGLAHSSLENSLMVSRQPFAVTAGSWTTSPGTRNPTIFAVASKGTSQTGYRCMINLGYSTSTNINFNGFFGTADSPGGTTNNNFATFFGPGGVGPWNDTSAVTWNNSASYNSDMLNNFSIWSVVNDGSVARPYVDGRASDTKVGTMGSDWNGFRIGGPGSTTLRQEWQGDIAEIIMISADFVTTDVRQRIEGYLAHKWGLAGKLAANHPYKNSPPMV